MAAHLAARGFRLLRRVVVVRAVGRPVRGPARRATLRATGGTAAGPSYRRPAAEPHVRRPTVQTRGPNPARVALHRWRRLVLYDAPRVDRDTSARFRQHATVHRARRAVLGPVSAEPVYPVVVRSGTAAAASNSSPSMSRASGVRCESTPTHPMQSGPSSKSTSRVGTFRSPP